MKKYGVKNVLVSILGHTAEIHDSITQHTGSFEKTIKGIQLLKSVGIGISANMVVSKANNEYINQVAQFVKTLEIKSFFATKAGCPGNCFDFSSIALDAREFSAYLNDLNDAGQKYCLKIGALEGYPLCGIAEVKDWRPFLGRRCLAGVTTFTVASDCNIRPCSHADIIYGNIKNDDILAIWERMQEWRDGSLLPTKCKECKTLSFCGGGCRMEAKMKSGNFASIDPYVVSENAEAAHKRFITTKKKGPLPSVPEYFRLNNNIRYRKESFGAIVFMGGKLSCYLNHEGFNFLVGLNRNVVYALADFQNPKTVDRSVFLAHFLQKRIILPDISRNPEKGDIYEGK